jgi:CDP-diacylglycerol--glycerol-3-phosphate 3-phosphatidyltransferase
VTTFGAFFDSVIDRYSDLVLYLGLLVYYANLSRNRYAVLVGVAMAGALMVSYTRARAESLIPSCKGGFFERPERIVLLIIGALADKMAPALWLLAIGPNLTVIHRIILTWREIQAGNIVDVLPRQGGSAEQEPPKSGANESSDRAPEVAGAARDSAVAREQEDQVHRPAARNITTAEAGSGG